MDTDYSKRVYQGVRVKHTVKDLLAEKRSRQTSGTRYSGGASTPPSFVQMPGSHMLPSYYSMRRSFISDSDLCPSAKHFSPEVYSSSLGGKSLGCDPSALSSYPSLIDSYYPESFGDYRGSTAFSGSGGSYLPSLLPPPFSGDSSHLFLRDSWEPAAAEPQVEALCPDSLASISVPASMPSPEPPDSPAQFHSSSRGSAPGGQSYGLHPLDEAHYHPLTSGATYTLPASSSSAVFPCTPYMGVELGSKMAPEDGDAHAHASLAAETQASWVKEDGVRAWSPYEVRRPF